MLLLEVLAQPVVVPFLFLSNRGNTAAHAMHKTLTLGIEIDEGNTYQ